LASKGRLTLAETFPVALVVPLQWALLWAGLWALASVRFSVLLLPLR
jgi:hypothetical protein